MPDDPKLAPYIEFRDVSKAFGDNVVLEHVNPTLVPREAAPKRERREKSA